jgi:hypothetical protein
MKTILLIVALIALKARAASDELTTEQRIWIVETSAVLSNQQEVVRQLFNRQFDRTVSLEAVQVLLEKWKHTGSVLNTYSPPQLLPVVTVPSSFARNDTTQTNDGSFTHCARTGLLWAKY